jgi:DNA polymerase III sliding clamp (beta) subunit (PCNA family)
VNAKTISDIVRTLDDEIVDLNVDQSKDTITIKTT